MIIRVATAADEPAIQDVIRVSYELLDWGWFPEDYHKDLYDIQSYYLDLGNVFLVAEVDGRVMATGAVDYFSAVPGETGTVVYENFVRIAGADCSLERLYVHPDARRQGLGMALWNRTIAIARDNQCKRMEIWSDKLLEDAHKMYQAKGAVVCGERLCHDPAQSPEWGMALDL